jgi:hypothetical protein
MFVLKMKRNRNFHAQLVVFSCSQIPRVYFQEIFASKVNDVTFWTLLVYMKTWKLRSKVAAIKTSFLYGGSKFKIIGQKYFLTTQIMWLLTCSWFHFNAIIVLNTHLFELMFEFVSSSIVKTIN